MHHQAQYRTLMWPGARSRSEGCPSALAWMSASARANVGASVLPSLCVNADPCPTTQRPAEASRNLFEPVRVPVLPGQHVRPGARTHMRPHRTGGARTLQTALFKAVVQDRRQMALTPVRSSAPHTGRCIIWPQRVAQWCMVLTRPGRWSSRR
jgi:hypothetical protein